MSVRPSSWIYLNPSTAKLLYILVYNSFWLAPVSPRLTIVLVAGKMLGVVEIASHGSNMSFDGESEDCPFGENGRRHGTARKAKFAAQKWAVFFLEKHHEILLIYERFN